MLSERRATISYMTLYFKPRHYTIRDKSHGAKLGLFFGNEDKQTNKQHQYKQYMDGFYLLIATRHL